MEGTYIDANTELEEWIIWYLLTYQTHTYAVLDRLTVDDFTGDDRQMIIRAAHRLYSKKTPVELVSLTQDLRANNENFAMPYILRCMDRVPMSVSIESWVMALRDITLKRNLGKLALTLYDQSHKANITGTDQLLWILKELDRLERRIITKTEATFKDRVMAVIKDIGMEKKSYTGILTGMREFDRIMAGYSNPDLTLIAGGPGEGKSTFALNQAKNIALTGRRTIYFSYEMKAQQLIWKMLSDEWGTPVADIRAGRIPSEKITETKLIDANLMIYDKGGITLDEMKTILKFEKANHNLQIAFIDYLQLIKFSNKDYHRRVSSKYDEISIISTTLKEIAMELDIPIVALSQVTRDKTRKKYRLSDLRDSGSLEQDADNVVFIFRPYVHHMDRVDFGGTEIQSDKGTTVVTVEKCRLGKTGDVLMRFNGDASRFEDVGAIPEETPF